MTRLHKVRNSVYSSIFRAKYQQTQINISAENDLQTERAKPKQLASSDKCLVNNEVICMQCIIQRGSRLL